MPIDSRRDRTVRRMVYRVLWPGFNGTTTPEWLARALDEGLGGALYFAHNFVPDDAQQPRRLSDRIHAISPAALLGVDEEGGIVTRLEAADGSSEPGNAVLGRVDDVQATCRSGQRIGTLVGSNGIDIDLAPVVDVNSDPRNPVIGVRSFGAHPQLVARHGAAMARGIQQAGVACCIKHFPGYGDVVSDPHLTSSLAHRTPEQFRSIHLPPFEAALRTGAQCVMSAHITVPYLGDDPATINPKALSILRKELGFDGVMICDALDMAAIADTIGQRRGGVAALLAGNDLLCIGNPAGHPGHGEDDFIRVRDGLFDALDDGSLPIETLERAGKRIERLSYWRAQHNQDWRALTSPSSRNTADGTRQAPSQEGEQLAARALEVHGDVRLAASGRPVMLVDARSSRSPVIGPGANRFMRALKERGLDVVTPQPYTGNAAAAGADGAARLIRQLSGYEGDIVLIAGLLLEGSEECAFVTGILHSKPQAVVLQTGWPATGGVVAGRMVRTYGDALPNARAAAGMLAPNRHGSGC
ncbi:glycoside hydrolase family 3 protein [Bifidobacterium sp.]|nr:glycoside hydrolase family 3 N-terminal domain-containing protein [Bifidobacterium sp.]MCI1224134.1 hypothetical protein [Bifidobacterium sp.]